MSDAIGSKSGSGNRKPDTAAMQAGRKASLAARANRPELSPGIKAAISQARAASRAAKLVAVLLAEGGTVDARVVEACGNLATIGTASLFR